MTQSNSLRDRHFVVWGLGKTGTATAGYLGRQGARVTVVEQTPTARREQSRNELAGLPIEYYWGGDLPNLTAFADIEAIILSPGVPYDIPPLVQARAAGIETIASMQWAAQRISTPMIAVTGAAGKSTTVSWIGEMLEASGLSTFVGGNLGTPLISLLEQEKPVERVVIECSSFQLEASPNLKPMVAVLTNMSPNHLDRHGTMTRYAACKAQLFNSLEPRAWAIRRADDPESDPVVANTQAPLLCFYPEGMHPQGAMLKSPEQLVLRHPHWGEECYDLREIKLRGQHNLENAMAAALTARLAGATPDGIQRALTQFHPLSHRLQEIACIHGVRYINDSKATTPRSTANAIAAFDPATEPLRLLLGGRSKGTDFRELLPAIRRGVKQLYLFGEAANEIGDALQDPVPTTRHPGLDQAVQQAHQDAEPGDVILLSPACTSYDQFRNFEERGEHFRKIVAALTSTSSPKKERDHA